MFLPIFRPRNSFLLRNKFSLPLLLLTLLGIIALVFNIFSDAYLQTVLEYGFYREAWSELPTTNNTALKHHTVSLPQISGCSRPHHCLFHGAVGGAPSTYWQPRASCICHPSSGMNELHQVENLEQI